MSKPKEQFDSCECGRIWPVRPDSSAICRACGGELVAIRGEVGDEERSQAYFEEWTAGVWERRQWGPSPLEAQHILECGRATVDALVNRGVLERNEFERDGHKLVVISWRSIKKAKANKKRHGSYTGQSVGRPSLKSELLGPTAGPALEA